MKKIFIIAVAFISAIFIGIFVINIYEVDTTVTQEITKVGLLLNGTKDDGNWCQSHYDGLQKTASQLNLEIHLRENVAAENVTTNIDELISKGCEIIIANSFEFGDGVKESAEKYPEIYFFHATGVEKGKNFSSYFGRMYQIRYLTGIVAGLQTKTNQIGYVAAYPISEVNRGINAFAIGVKSVNPEATVYVSWTNSWTDDDSTKSATELLLDKYDIDVISMHTDSLKPLEVADERNVLSIGYNVDNSQSYPETFITAAVWDWEKFYTPNILRCLQGKFVGNHYWEGVETGIVSLAPFSEKVNEGIKEKIDIELVRLNSGTYDVFYGPITDQSGNIRIADGESMTDYSMLNEFDWYVEGVVICDEE
ncbi:MAG: BMP family ABC transporter substrate-binding protein [Lachnospiraceae bacterium]|nr:BMP family ABC transporter substrate-binding protein [Lachnospiraceae bacterium]